MFITAQDRDTAKSDSTAAGASRLEAVNGDGRPTDVARVHAAEHRRASVIIGMDIMNMQDEKVGSVDDLAVDLSSGRVTAVIISSGGFLGIADELSIIPPSALTLTDDNDAFSANLTKDQLTNAPRFQGSKYPDLNDQKYMSNVCTAYQAEPYLDSVRADTTADAGRRVLRASEILGMDVNNHLDETIGDINELILNRSLDRITSVVVSSGGFLGIGNTLSMLPSETVTTTKDAVLVNATRETLEGSPRFAENEWPERMNEPSYLVTVYEPYQFSTNYDNGADEESGVSANVDSERVGKDKSPEKVDRDQDKGSRKLTAEDQSNAPGDLDATTQIRREIVSHDDLSFAAKNIRVITVGGKVTLAGQVASEQEMDTILKIARGQTGEGTVTNKLSVEN